MISKNNDHTSAIQMVSIDQLVPEDHLLRKIDAAIDFNFIYDLVEDKYSADTGRPSIDPVTLIKIPIIQYKCYYSTCIINLCKSTSSPIHHKFFFYSVNSSINILLRINFRIHIMRIYSTDVSTTSTQTKYKQTT